MGQTPASWMKTRLWLIRAARRVGYNDSRIFLFTFFVPESHVS
jgi:hypothetical protein